MKTTVSTFPDGTTLTMHWPENEADEKMLIRAKSCNEKTLLPAHSKKGHALLNCCWPKIQ